MSLALDGAFVLLLADEFPFEFLFLLVVPPKPQRLDLERGHVLLVLNTLALHLASMLADPKLRWIFNELAC